MIFIIKAPTTAFNRTGNIDFQNKVTIGQLDSLELSLSGGVKLQEICISRELGNDEIGGPSDARLATQLATYGYLTGHLDLSLIKINQLHQFLLLFHN